MSIKWLVRGSRLACVLVALGSAPLAAVAVGRIVGVLVEQAHGRVAGTDFVNLYTGASLLAQAPTQVYSPSAQHAFEQALTEPGHPYLGFFLPPPSLVLVSWLAWLPYSLAYAAWLALGLACVVGAAWLLGGPGWRGRLGWLAGLLLFLPILEGLGQGQTSALLLLGMAALARGLFEPRAPRWLWLALLACLVKPQFGVVPVVAVALDRRFGMLVRAGVALAGLTLLSVVWAGPTLLTSYRELSSAKLVESLTAPPDFLPGPTLLHALQRLFGTGTLADALGLSLALLVLLGLACAWRRAGLPADEPAQQLDPGGADHVGSDEHGVLATGRRRLCDQRRLGQVALLPLAGVLVAPYALVHELSCWPVAFWLLERYTRRRPLARAVLLLIASGVWLTGALAVLEPNASRGADLAALLGLAVVVWLLRDLAVTPRCTAAALPLPTMPAWRPARPARRLTQAEEIGPAL